MKIEQKELWDLYTEISIIIAKIDVFRSKSKGSRPLLQSMHDKATELRHCLGQEILEKERTPDE